MTDIQIVAVSKSLPKCRIYIFLHTVPQWMVMDIIINDITEDHITVATQTMHYSREIPQIYHTFALFNPTQKRPHLMIPVFCWDFDAFLKLISNSPPAVVHKFLPLEDVWMLGQHLVSLPIQTWNLPKVRGNMSCNSEHLCPMDDTTGWYQNHPNDSVCLKHRMPGLPMGFRA